MTLTTTDFIFSSKYRLWRHLLFWLVFTFLTSIVYVNYSHGSRNLQRQMFLGTVWLPARILYCYPLMYWVIPNYLLKSKYVQFAILIIIWFTAGWLLNYLFRANIFIPLQVALGFNNIVMDPWQPGSFLLLTTAAGLTCIIVLFKYWFRKQQEWLQAEKEKVSAELQLLRAQVHPHFLFNTLNNIYSFSLENSPKTPGLILKLSSLLSYVLYDCRTDEVLLENEIAIMKNYIDLEKERYGNKIEISWGVKGDLSDKYISPLLLLPFIENAFKHGTSDQLEKPWLSVDMSVNQDSLKCKIANSKNENVSSNKVGIGIENVKKRLALLYPENHELKLSDAEDFFVVSLSLRLRVNKVARHNFSPEALPQIQN